MTWLRCLTVLVLFLLLGVTLGGCSSSVKRESVVSNASTPVQVLQVKKGRYLDLTLPMAGRNRWWAVESGARPWLQPKLEPQKSRIRLLAVKPGKTEVVCVLRDTQRVIRRVVVAVEVERVEE